MDSKMDSSIVIKNARIIDTAQDIDAITHIAIIDGKIHSIGDDVHLESDHILDARGYILTPGWIDCHVHCYEHSTPLGINADRYCLSRGVTAAVDAGSAGSSTFPGLQKYVIEKSSSRIFSFLHIASHGLASAGCAGQGAGGECDSLNQVSVDKCLSSIRQNPNHIVGIKVRLTADVADNGKNEAEVYRRALYCARKTNLPIMTHHSASTIPTQGIQAEGLGCPANLRSGDIYTHCFHGWESSILDNSSSELTIHRDVLAAKMRGVFFDVGHGWGSFHWGVAEFCLKSGFLPDIISTDLHKECIDGPAYDLATVMSKLLCVGMPIKEIIKAVTETPAKAIQRSHSIGSLHVGREADMTLCKIEECDVEMEDCCGQIRTIKERIKPIRVWRAGNEYPIIDIETWPNRTKWATLASNWDKLEIRDSRGPTEL